MITIKRQIVTIHPDPKRVFLRFYQPGDLCRSQQLVDRICSLSDERVADQLTQVFHAFAHRHKDSGAFFLKHFHELKSIIPYYALLSHEKKLLIGAYFSMEFSLESIALFNPSMVKHPDQQHVPLGCTRFLLSLRAVGEGNVSSIVFREGLIDENQNILLDPLTPFVEDGEKIDCPLYDRNMFQTKLAEINAFNSFSADVFALLPLEFTLQDLVSVIAHYQAIHSVMSFVEEDTYKKMRWLAISNYFLHFHNDQTLLTERVIFPINPHENKGIEDARWVEFMDDDGQIIYYATYTATDGIALLPQLLETTDFRNFRIITLNGNVIQNRGLALFPRKINGCFFMLGRMDGQRIFLLTSSNIHFWNDAQLLAEPLMPWEFVQMGNCGAPLEIDAGWLVITHGVGPCRQYCLGALLLDKHNPSRVIGRLSEPFLLPEESERSGLVPNVVYSCGAMIHKDSLVIPYSASDTSTAFAIVSISMLVEKLIAQL